MFIRTLLESIFCLSMDGREELMKELAYFLEDCNCDQVRESDLSGSSIFASMNKQFPRQVVDTITQWILRLFFERADGNFVKA
jgi:hypothetical protein